MSRDALFLNGVYQGVLDEILDVQREMREQIMFLQPYSSSAIVRLRDNPPTVDNPWLLVISTTKELSTVGFKAEIVGWNDKRQLQGTPRHDVLTRLIWTLQPKEGGLYNQSTAPGGVSVNLLHIRRLEVIGKPFSVTQLLKAKDDEPVSDQRATAGGWAYIKADELEKVLLEHQVAK